MLFLSSKSGKEQTKPELAADEKVSQEASCSENPQNAETETKTIIENPEGGNPEQNCDENDDEVFETTETNDCQVDKDGNNRDIIEEAEEVAKDLPQLQDESSVQRYFEKQNF